MTQWFRAMALYREPRVLGVLFLGFSSGLPFLLTLGTLHAWLSEAGISKTVMGLFALATAPYALKFLWAPFADHIKIPFLSNRLGQRRSWMLTSQVALMGSLIGLGCTDPYHNIWLTGLFTFLVSICASSQDNVTEAYRIESLNISHAGPGASASVTGFRLGMWVSGGGALYLSAYFSWFFVYALMACCVLIGIFTTLLLPEPQSPPLRKSTSYQSLSAREKFSQIIRPGIMSFFRRPDWILIIFFVFLYKIGDTVLNMISIPFLLEIGFSNVEIAHIAKTFGIIAMMLGGILGGLFIAQFGVGYNLILSTVLLIASCFMFMIQATYGHHIHLLIITIGIENFAGGMSAAALITYLSQMCQQPNTATTFAILSSFSSLARVSLSVAAGWLADQLSWVTFFAVIASGCVFALIFLIINAQKLLLSPPSPSLMKEEILS